MLARYLIAIILSVTALTMSATANAATATLQDGQNAYAGTRDTTISSGTTGLGTATNLNIGNLKRVLARFAIFAAEGGPVPDGATINTATLSLYKYSDTSTGTATFTAKRLLKNWHETEANWNLSLIHI